MKGDFSRLTFDPKKDYTGVLMQQGRVLLDADWNEQLAIGLHEDRQLLTSLFAWHGTIGAVFGGRDFHVKFENGKIQIHCGQYYVDGLRNVLPVKTADPPELYAEVCEYRDLGAQPNYPGRGNPTPPTLTSGIYLAYLDCWERHVSWAHEWGENDSLREPALGGPDTATRSQLVWQVRLARFDYTAGGPTLRSEVDEDWTAIHNSTLPAFRELLKLFEFDSGQIVMMLSQKMITLGKEEVAQLRQELGTTSNQLRTLLKYFVRTIGTLLPLKALLSYTSGDAILKTGAQFRELLNQNAQQTPQIDHELLDWHPPTQGRLEFKVQTDGNGARVPGEVCASSHSTAARVGNRLYRVEIHRSGQPAESFQNVPEGSATFKWSSDNGSVGFPIESKSGNEVTVGALKPEANSELRPDAWIEIFDEVDRFRHEPPDLYQIKTLELESRVVVLDRDVSSTIELDRRPILRVWHPGTTEHASPRGIPIVEDVWIPLEAGLQVKFTSADSETFYRTSDYWNRPVRLGSREETPAVAETDGIEHRYAPLAAFNVTEAGPVAESLVDLRRYLPLHKLSSPAHLCPGDFKAGAAANEPSGTAERGDSPPAVPAPADPAPADPAAAAPAPAVPPATEPAPVEPPSIDQGARWESDLIAPEYHDTLRSLFVSTRDVTRQIPARCLSCEPESAALRRWLGSALVSEITGLGCDEFLKRVHDLAIDEEDRESVQRDARTVWRMAKRLESNIAATPHWKLKQEAVA